jgi:hypothetical protein
MLTSPSPATGWFDLALLATFVGFFWALGSWLLSALLGRFRRRE